MRDLLKYKRNYESISRNIREKTLSLQTLGARFNCEIDIKPMAN
jgi:hypothetical protein